MEEKNTVINSEFYEDSDEGIAFVTGCSNERIKKSFLEWRAKYPEREKRIIAIIRGLADCGIIVFYNNEQ